MLTFLKLVISTFVLIGHRSRAVAWGLSQGRRSPLCNHRHNSDFPNVTMSVPSNSTEVWFGNDTFRILQNMDLGINLTCESRYPIQWVETYDKESDGLGGVRPASLVKGLWNEVVEGAEDETWSYRTVFSSQFSGSVCSVSNYTCQAVDDLCLRTNVILHLDQATDLVNMHLTQGPNRDDELQRRTEVGKEDECAAIVSYWLHPMKPHYGWKCEIASSGKIITDRNQFLICDSAAHCNTFYRHQRMGTKCLRRVADCYYYCAYTNDNSYKPGFVTCRDQGILLAQHYFYSVPQTPHETPEIYFDWSEADPQKMLVIEPLSNETYLMDTVTVFCQLSRYYFAYGHRFAVGSENGSVDYKMAVDGEYVEVYNTNRINLTIELTTLGAVDVYCLAPVWNSTDWVNQSISINVLPDPEPPSFAFTEDEEETLVWFTGDSNKSIICRGQGKPSPVVRWSDVVPGSKYVENSVDKTTTEIEFPIVSDEVEGEYVCEAENFLKISRKTFRVVVIDPFKLVVKTVSIVASCVLMLCLVVMFLCWKTIRDQRKQIRLLSEAEIKEFLEGNIEAVQSNDYLDTSDLIQSLPYNPKFEIPKEMIHIDQSKVLGSGNFGQVLKGSIQLLDSQNGSRSMKTALKGMNSIDVAVKTVKHNMEVLYFKTLLSEVKIMAYIGSHPNICSLVGACTQNIRKREIFIAVEFCTNGSLEHYLRKQRPVFINLVKNDAIVPQEPKQRNPYENVDAEYGGADMTNNKLTPITTQNLIKWSREIANGMEFLGSKKIIHGDLATRNVFLSDELVVKIGDFGLSRQLLNYSNYIKNQESPLPFKWMAVESLQQMRFSVFSDIWAYGVTTWEIFTLANVPYPGVTWSDDFLDQLVNGMRMHKPSYATTNIYNTMLDCWNNEPSLRPSFSELKIFFEKLLVDTSPQNYFQPSFEGFVNHVANDGGTSEEGRPQVFIPPQNNLSPDSGIAEDTQGYLLPFSEPRDA